MFAKYKGMVYVANYTGKKKGLFGNQREVCLVDEELNRIVVMDKDCEWLREIRFEYLGYRVDSVKLGDGAKLNVSLGDKKKEYPIEEKKAVAILLYDCIETESKRMDIISVREMIGYMASGTKLRELCVSECI